MTISYESDQPQMNAQQGNEELSGWMESAQWSSALSDMLPQLKSSVGYATYTKAKVAAASRKRQDSWRRIESGRELIQPMKLSKIA